MVVAMALLTPTGTAIGQTFYTGGAFRLHFDLSTSAVQPPYDQFTFLISFSPPNLLDQGEAFSYQLFDSSGVARSTSTSYVSPLKEPSINVAPPTQPWSPTLLNQGYVEVRDITGSFTVGRDQWGLSSSVIAYRQADPVLSTGYVPGIIETLQIPEPQGLPTMTIVALMVHALAPARRRGRPKRSEGPHKGRTVQGNVCWSRLPNINPESW